jgi:LacI family transcriptional regulator
MREINPGAVNGRPTLADVAREAGVSLKTASRVVNNERYVRTVLREQVAGAVQKLGYRSNDLARHLVLQTTRTIGLVIADISNPFYGACALGVMRVARRHGYTVVLNASDEGVHAERDYVALLVQQRVAGLLLVPAPGDHTYLTTEISRGLRIVALDRPLQGLENDCAIVENEPGAFAATDHLIQHGRRRIAFLGGSESIFTYAMRLEGYRRAMAAAGAAEMINLVNPTVEGALADTRRLLTGRHRPDAILCVNNRVTVGALTALVQMGVTIPDELALVGFDDFELADVFHPPLTMVRQPAIALGMNAATLLIDRIEGRETGAPRTIVLPVELMIRDSCGSHDDFRSPGAA